MSDLNVQQEDRESIPAESFMLLAPINLKLHTMLVLYLLKYSISQYRFDENYHLASGQGIRNLHHFSQCLSTPYNRNYSTCI